MGKVRIAQSLCRAGLHLGITTVGRILKEPTLQNRYYCIGLVFLPYGQDKPILTIDLLGDEFLEAVNTGDPISIKEDGTVEVG
jgi:hypothetical protein